jgi:ribosomal protein L11 methyltransferase
MIELSLLAPEARVEGLSDMLMDELDALSVSVEDADADTDAENALFGEPGMPAPASAWQRSRVSALFSDSDGAERAALELLSLGEGAVSVQGIRAVADDDWVRRTQSQFAPVHIDRDFWVVPSWHAVPEGARPVIRLDPGLAFGTGTHPTTRMCLRWLSRQSASGSGNWSDVLDYGCGSGILAIASAQFGAQRVDAVDIDLAAVAATRDNAASNGVQIRSGLPDQVEGPYELVLANILASPLRLLAPVLCSLVRSGGHLLLAGLLTPQAEELIAVYAPWIALEAADAEEGWTLLVGRRA